MPSFLHLKHKLRKHIDLFYVIGLIVMRAQPLGNLYIEYKGHENVSEYKRWLDISDATAHDSYMLEGGLFTTDCFVSAPDSVLVICLKSEAPIDAVVRMDSQQPHKVSSSGKEVTVDGYTAYLSYPTNHVPAGETEDIKYDPERGIHFRTIAHVEAADGSVSANPDGSLSLSGCHNVTILVADVTSFNSGAVPVLFATIFSSSATTNVSLTRVPSLATPSMVAKMVPR